jgi:hydroxymethylglutaryl-CoA lyase
MDLPSSVTIKEEGPREGFQIEKDPIATSDKITLIDALSECGLKQIEVASFVNTKRVPGWADAESVVDGFSAREGIQYSALWFNDAGMRRAQQFHSKLSLSGYVSVSASEPFSVRNLNRKRTQQLEAMKSHLATHAAAGIPIEKIIVMAAFGCNFAGDIAPTDVTNAVGAALDIASDGGIVIGELSLADSMGWATPKRVAATIGAVRERWPDLTISLHLHDTRGLGIANAYEGLRLGVRKFDAAVGGLGGCPFAGQPGAPGNIATEELALLCDEMGIETGIDLGVLVETGRLAERIVGRPLPSNLLRSGGLAKFRAGIS